MRYCLPEAPESAASPSGDTVEVRRLFDDASGCEKFAQRLLAFPAGSSPERIDREADEVLYTLNGTGTAHIGGVEHELRPGVGLFVGRDTSWSLEGESLVELLSVLVHDPQPLAAGTHGAIDLAGAARGEATADRRFTLGVTPDVGCASVTQFIGFVPPGRAPDHFHRYDEVLYVLEGDGVLHIDGRSAPFRRGSAVHLPARLVHSLENTGDVELQLLGVFRPAGSPAEAYYPDGTPAAAPEPTR